MSERQIRKGILDSANIIHIKTKCKQNINFIRLLSTIISFKKRTVTPQKAQKHQFDFKPQPDKHTLNPRVLPHYNEKGFCNR